VNWQKQHDSAQLMTIDSKQAIEALSEIDAMVRRVRQSRIYDIASLNLIMWGALVLAGNIASHLWPPQAGYLWIAVNAAGVAGSLAIGAFKSRRMSMARSNLRVLAASVLFFGFGILWSIVLGHFSPRQLSVFWPTYFSMIYTTVGLWFGWAFVAIGLSITALTLLGYFFAGDWFELWMAVVNGGGLVLGGLWMRRS
jgi:hypothetical protein